MATGRFPALSIASDGTLYGSGGMNGHTQIMRWHPGTDRIESFFNLRDDTIQATPARIRDLAVDDRHQLYLAENDNHSAPAICGPPRCRDEEFRRMKRGFSAEAR